MSHSVLTLAAVVLATSTSPELKLPASLDLTTIRALPVQHDGRWPPLDTAARDIVESVTGDAVYQGHDAALVLLAWTFDAQTWMHRPLLAIENDELRAELRLPPSKTAFSFVELTSHRYLHTLVDDLAIVEQNRKLNPLESKVSGIHEKLRLLQRVFHGQAIRPIPANDDVTGAWHPIVSSALNASSHADPVGTAWTALGRAFLTDDAAAFAAAANQLVAALEGLPAAHRPNPKLVAAELRYNELRPFRLAWIIMTAGALLAAAATLVRRKWFDWTAALAMMTGFVLLTYGLWLRWQIAGRIPAANMFESLLFLSWGTGAFAIVSMLIFRQRVVLLTASAMGALTLVLADCLPIDHFIRPIAPVLMDTVWMSIHVPIIMASYSVLALAVLIAHVQLVFMAVVPGQRRLADRIDSLHYWYIHVGSILLLAGIITGSMWAASSWGRYWGWDPKEVWSLVAFLGYLAILHVRIDHGEIPRWVYAAGGLLALALFVAVAWKLAPLTPLKLLAFAGAAAAVAVFVMARSQFATALKSILAFWLIIMTYVGVNYVLGVGLHSYGFGTGAVVRYLFRIGGIDLFLVAVCGLIYAARRGWQPGAALVRGSPVSRSGGI